MTDRPVTDPIPAPIARLVTLFDGPLADVRFPSVDRDVLAALADDVRARAEALEEARSALERARAHLDDGHKELQKTAELALAYAKVFANADEALSAELEGLSFTSDKRADKKPREKKRASEPKADKSEAKAQKKPGAGLELPLVKQDEAVLDAA